MLRRIMPTIVLSCHQEGHLVFNQELLISTMCTHVFLKHVTCFSLSLFDQARARTSGTDSPTPRARWRMVTPAT